MANTVTAVRAFEEAKGSDHTVWFHSGSFVFWRGGSAATLDELWDRCEIQAHGSFSGITIRVEAPPPPSLLSPLVHALTQIKEIARMLDTAFAEGRKHQAEEIRKAIHWTSGV